MAESNKMYKMKLTYRNVNGYLIPNVNYKSGEQRESKVRRESWKCGLRLFLCLKGSDKFEQEVFEALHGNQSRRNCTDVYPSDG